MRHDPGMSRRIAVLGAGSWGTALAHTLAQDERRVVALWARRRDQAEEIVRTRRNPLYLPELVVDGRVSVSAALPEVLEPAEIVILAVPTQAMREVASAASSALHADAVVVSAAKGFEAETALTMTAVLREVLGPAQQARIAALSGPNIAVEVAAGL